LFAVGTVDDILARVLDLAKATVEGCDYAGVVLMDGDTMLTPAHSDPSWPISTASSSATAKDRPSTPLPKRHLLRRRSRRGDALAAIRAGRRRPGHP